MRCRRAWKSCRRAARCCCRRSTSTASATERAISGIRAYGPNPVPPARATFYSRGYQLTFRSRCIRPQNWLQYDQAELQVQAGRSDVRPGRART